MRRHRGSPVEERQLPALVAEEAQRWIHPINAGDQPRRHVMTQIDIGLAQRQQVEQQIKPGPGVAREMAAIRQDLTVELAIQVA